LISVETIPLAWIHIRQTNTKVDMSRFDAAPLIAFIAAKETDYGNETDGRIPG
jgi:hypothetical protein